MYSTIIFDLDGTLLDTTQGVINAVKRMIEQMNLQELPMDTLKEFVGPPMQDSLKRYYKMSDKEALENTNIFRDFYKRYSLFEAKLYDGIYELLTELKNRNINLCVATNKSHENAVSILHYFGITNLVDYVMGADLQGKFKKEDIVRSCMNACGAKKSGTVLIGDSMYDYVGARATGIDFIAVLYGFGFKSANDLDGIECAGLCHTVSELNRILLTTCVQGGHKDE
ncbi:HAD family hydrolase [Clostridiales bacterium TF09-2AC]|uniref:HAD hydrolase-like protein n=1 Tax=Enterocloster hominis (ex Hitch et al. 2024) TaxID=1917870 RepID=UPI000E746D6E|nr:HAD hydrolase-like protein [Lachnoclostridium pacaense]MCC2878535.1 HAD hydrolase-like protein [Lachnoclostridium pacaense]RJW37284.1 HAD family hydrolase [Clostridiales bacterium TF09-2AC]